MTANGELYPLPTPSGLEELRSSITSESGFGLPENSTPRVPTPRKIDGMSATENTTDGALVRRAEAGFCNLPEFIQVQARGLGVSRVPTPTVADKKSPGPRKNPRAQQSLSVVVRRVPTPTAQDAKNNGAPSQLERNTKPLNAEVGGPLNPEWVEWLMGWPVGWTDLHAQVTDRSLTQWLSRGGFSSSDRP